MKEGERLLESHQGIRRGFTPFENLGFAGCDRRIDAARHIRVRKADLSAGIRSSHPLMSARRCGSACLNAASCQLTYGS